MVKEKKFRRFRRVDANEKVNKGPVWFLLTVTNIAAEAPQPQRLGKVR